VLGRTLDGMDVRVRHVDADRPAGLARVDVLVDGQVVADADWRACIECGVAVLEHVRTDPDHRGHGYARQAVLAAHARAPHCSWSTTTVADGGAAAFWAALDDRFDTSAPRYCPHMAGRLDVPDY
jgi:GNAT superfamily N-acetyltransferase